MNENNYGLSNEEEELEKERIKREKYREELALEIEERRLSNIRREEFEKQLENAANIRDAQRFSKILINIFKGLPKKKNLMKI